ncbi:hypothetical protein [Alteromonas sp. M12]|uniref:hypothetical protein n=1 Tax=Alteromonas sp. M12 TaxID=3135644 RepID=UPI00319D9AEE
MKRFMKYIFTVVIFTGWMGAAQASLIFDFTFTNSANGGGVVSGEILGLVNNNTVMASSVKILSNSAGFGIGSYSAFAYLNLFYDHKLRVNIHKIS